MKTVLERRARSTLTKFAEAHGLTLVVTERASDSHPDVRFYARFERADVKEGRFLVGEYGNGRTPAQAKRAYARAISEKTLVIDAWGGHGHEIVVPILTT